MIKQFVNIEIIWVMKIIIIMGIGDLLKEQISRNGKQGQMLDQVKVF